jgi:hypothetical protein
LYSRLVNVWGISEQLLIKRVPDKIAVFFNNFNLTTLRLRFRLYWLPTKIVQITTKKKKGTSQTLSITINIQLILFKKLPYNFFNVTNKQVHQGKPNYNYVESGAFPFRGFQTPSFSSQIYLAPHIYKEIQQHDMILKIFRCTAPEV